MPIHQYLSLVFFDYTMAPPQTVVLAAQTDISASAASTTLASYEDLSPYQLWSKGGAEHTTTPRVQFWHSPYVIPGKIGRPSPRLRSPEVVVPLIAHLPSKQEPLTQSDSKASTPDHSNEEVAGTQEASD